jgi:hypothetical protein
MEGPIRKEGEKMRKWYYGKIPVLSKPFKTDWDTQARKIIGFKRIFLTKEEIGRRRRRK